MPKFLIRKSQEGQDQWDDEFVWQVGDVILDAPTEDTVKKLVDLMDGVLIYAGEALVLRYVGPYDGKKESTTMLDFLRSYAWGVGSRVHRHSRTAFDEFNRRWNTEGGGLEYAIRYALEQTAPELVSAVFAN